jgi:hypothetical protein
MTITASTIAELPPTIPNDLRQLLVKSEEALTGSFQGFSWNSLPGVFFCFGHIDKTKTVYGAADVMDNGVKKGAERVSDVLNAMAAVRGVPMIAQCRYHVGYGVLSEGLHGTTDEVYERLNATRSGEEMTSLIEDLTATGEVSNWRMLVGVLVSGWSYEMIRHRGQEALEINVYPVGEAPKNNEIHLILRDFNERVPKDKLKVRRR